MPVKSLPLRRLYFEVVDKVHEIENVKLEQLEHEQHKNILFELDINLEEQNYPMFGKKAKFIKVSIFNFYKSFNFQFIL